MFDKYQSQNYKGQQWEEYEHRFDGKLNTDAEALAAVKELLSSRNNDFVELVSANQLPIGSAGCGVTRGSSLVPAYFVNRVTKDSPAARAGIHLWDQILAVDSVPMSPRLPRAEAMRMLTGSSGKIVNVKIQRLNPGGLSETTGDISVTLSDKDPEPKSYFQLLQNHYAYIKPAFPLTPRAKFDEFKDAVVQLKQSSAAGIILDLRANTEDMTNIAELCGIFVGDKPAYATLTKGNVQVHNGVGQALTSLPIVALIGSDTNTSAQALAACLKSNKRATLMGDETEGSNVVVGTEKLDQRYNIKLPVFEYVTLEDTGGYKNGRVEPDIFEVIYKTEIEDGPWWNVSLSGKAPSPLDGKDVVLNLALNEISIQSGISKGPRQTPRRKPSPNRHMIHP